MVDVENPVLISRVGKSKVSWLWREILQRRGHWFPEAVYRTSAIRNITCLIFFRLLQAVCGNISPSLVSSSPLRLVPAKDYVFAPWDPII